MKKNNMVWIGLAVIVVLAVGGYLIFHKSSTPSNGSTANSTSNSSNASTVNNAVLKTMSNTSLGKYLADPSGKALYTYGGDTAGVSNCTSTCLSNWPAYIDKGSTSGLPTGVSTIKRPENGQNQYTYNGLPLYYFVGDSGTKVTGNGVDNFAIAKPAASSSSSSSSSTGTSPSSTSNSAPNSPY